MHYLKQACGDLRNKRILITAGPTRVPIDSVRVISNLATGKTGRLIAQKLKRKRAKITLLFGPLDFTQLQSALRRELKEKKFDIVIHSAAVSDYRLKTTRKSKINSGIRNLKLELVPTAKIIESIKKLSPGVFLVGFKFQPQATKEVLIRGAQRLRKKASADMVVANTIIGKSGYRAYLLGPGQRVCGPYMSKGVMAAKLTGLLEEFYQCKFN